MITADIAAGDIFIEIYVFHYVKGENKREFAGKVVQSSIVAYISPWFLC